MKAWDQFLSKVGQKLGENTVTRWLKPLKIVRFDAANLYLESNDPMEISFFEEHIRPLLKTDFLNENFRPIKVHFIAKSVHQKDGLETQARFYLKQDPIDPSYLFQNFITNSENLVAYKLLSEISTHSSPHFNPIFLYGPPHCGKTHLLMALYSDTVQTKKVIYVHANTFTDHVVHAIRTSNMQAFRKIYREIDLLIVDSIESLSGRTATQEEFFHTFNTLHTLGKQIVLSSQKPPSKLENIESRLISRFEWGIFIPLQPINPEQILIQKAQSLNLNIASDLPPLLISLFKDQFLVALQALALRAPDKILITTKMAKEILADLIKKNSSPSITPEQILQKVSHYYGIGVDDILGKGQSKEISIARQFAMYIFREKLEMPYQAIGKYFGRDHSTVMSSVKLIQKAIEEKKTEILTVVEKIKP